MAEGGAPRREVEIKAAIKLLGQKGYRVTAPLTDFSWFGGEVDRELARRLAELKRQGKI